MDQNTTTSQTVNSSQVPPSPVVPENHQDGMSEDTKGSLVALLLVWFYPVGLIFMFIWMRRWPVWAKIIILLPLIFGILVFVLFGAVFFSAINSEGFLGNTIQCAQQCETSSDQETCMAECVELPENMEYNVEMDSESTGSYDFDTQTPSERSPQ